MNGFYWNARGFGNADTKITLNFFYLSHNPTVIFLGEPLITFAQVSTWYSSHIFKEGNCCADLLANMGHSLQGTIWFSVLPQALQADYFRVRCGMPNYRFP